MRVNRYRREAERHYQVVEDHLAGRDFIVGDSYTIADMSLWGWIDRASRVMKGEADPLRRISEYQELVRVRSMRARPLRAREPSAPIMHFKQERDEQALRALFPSNYPPRVAVEAYQTVDGAAVADVSTFLEL